MTNPEHVEALLAEVEDDYAAMGYVGLYEFSWSLRGLRLGLDEDAVMAVARAAYDEFVKRHSVDLVWVPWPVDTSRATPAPGGTPLEFDIDRDASASIQLLALVPRTAP